MSFSHVPIGAALALCLASVACSAPTNHGMSAPPPVPEVEEELTLTVDALDVRHGGLRVEASMVEGSADVAMWLGPSCETREVGRGIATRRGFAWTLSADEMARAIECSLTVRVRTIDDDGARVRKVAKLPVSVALVPDAVESARLASQEARGPSTKLNFLTRSRARRLHVGNTLIGAELEETSEPTRRGLYASAFVVGNDDLARSMLGRRRLSILGEHFLAAMTVGEMTLDVSDPEEETESGSEG
jgi:hypothetical protein